MDVDVLIMAGGRGNRLRPLTDHLPKSLIELEGKPLLEIGLSQLKHMGLRRVHIAINYMGEKIVETLGDGSHMEMELIYLREARALGTLGALGCIEAFEHDQTLVINGDLLTNLNYQAFLDHHLAKKAEFSIVTTTHQYRLPFAVIENGDGRVTTLAEKPLYDFCINAGIYLIHHQLAQQIPPQTKLDATSLIQQCLAKGYHVVHYPFSGYWRDIGSLEELAQARQDIREGVFAFQSS